MKSVHQRLHLYTDGDDAFILAPVVDSAKHPVLSISRATGEVVLNSPSESLPSNTRRFGKAVYGIVGILALTLSEYLVVITGRESRGHILGHEVFRATDFEILPLNPNVSVHNPPHPVETHLLALLKSHLYGGYFLFSYGQDITRRLQTQWENLDLDEGKAYFEVADDRFFWNKFMQTRLIEASGKQDLSGYILPLIYGTFDVRRVFLNGRQLQLCLTSRRSRYRAGTRYFRRGIDSEGHVANFNETEQILILEQPNGSSEPSYAAILSFVQIRGSVPLYWAEINTLRYKPDLQVMDLETTTDAMKMHLLEQASVYGAETLVNLVNHKGHEAPVKEAFERYIAQLSLPDVRYEYFDFHNECKHMRWDRISVLIDKLKEDLERDGYFHLDAVQNVAIRKQEGVVRTNCMDNLDRTNVVQAALAKWTLSNQLRTLDILREDRTTDDYEALSTDLREMWADHADMIAKAYGGSGALKSDFTRTGKRTRKGALEDGLKSILRYIKNNYFDGPRQDAFDLVTGQWIPRQNPANSLFLITDPRPLAIRAMPPTSFFCLFMIAAGLTLPRTSDYSLTYYFLLWFSLLFLSLGFILAHGIDYVSWPKLLPPTDIIHFNGPGFRSAHNGKGLRNFPLKLGSTSKYFNSGHRRPGSKVGIDEIEMQGLKKRVD